jgi:hypothetical protein
VLVEVLGQTQLGEMLHHRVTEAVAQVARVQLRQLQVQALPMQVVVVVVVVRDRASHLLQVVMARTVVEPAEAQMLESVLLTARLVRPV